MNSAAQRTHCCSGVSECSMSNACGTRSQSSIMPILPKTVLGQEAALPPPRIDLRDLFSMDALEKPGFQSVALPPPLS